MSGTGQDDRLREAWRDGYDAAAGLVDVAASAGHAKQELARAVAHSRDDMEARYFERQDSAALGEHPARPNTEGAKR